MASYQPATTSASEVTGSLQGPRRPPDGQWSRDGGVEVTVAHGDTIEAIARRHNVPASAILQANGLTHASTLHPGQRLMIPRHSVAARSPAPAVPNPPAPARTMATPVAANGTHIVASGDTLSKIARKYGKSVPELARANNLEPTAPLKLGDRLIIPGVAPRATASKAQPKTLAGPPPKVAPVPKQQANNTNEQPQQTLVVSPPTESPAAAPAKSADAGPSFRWPVKGRIIAGFGPKPNGQQNDGINVSVPEGTPIKAAEDGVVAYSGNELKGYGNLVLVRHPNGYVTAYAHAKELNVKRGDQIKRGQVIGKAGQTGDVDAPQLHFEVRKGPTPLDPMGMLNGG
jgi:murein DD-endopeptidase MepM/ murein hydrolase activator NlpD